MCKEEFVSWVWISKEKSGEQENQREDCGRDAPQLGTTGCRRSFSVMNSFVFSECDDVGHKVVQLVGGNLVVAEGGHSAEADADLCFHKPDGGWFVVNAGGEAAFAAGMALVTMSLKDQLASLNLCAASIECACDGFTPADRAAAGEKNREDGGDACC
jgi:hypothetical protein